MAITPQQAHQQLVRMGDPRAIRRLVRNTLRRGATSIVNDDIARLRSQGVGRRIFGTKKFRKKHTKGLVSISKARSRGDVEELDIKAKGLAAIQEQGGTTAPHVIKPGAFKLRGVPVLVFRVPGGLVVTPHAVNHQGATHPRMPHLRPAIERGAPKITDDIRQEMDAHIDRSLR